MFHKLRSRLSYANVMSTIAVFTALGGSAYAAATITGADVVNDSLTGEDVQGRGGSAPVNGSLTSADIGGQAADPATGTPFVEGTLTQWDIRNGTLGTDDVANNSLTGADIDEGTLVGGPGSPSGAAGGDLTGSYPNPQIRSNAVGSNEISDFSITGSDINESTLSRPAYAHIVDGAVDAANSKNVVAVAATTGVICLRVFQFQPKNGVATIDPSGANTRDHVSVTLVPSVVLANCPASAEAIAFTVTQAGALANLPFYIVFN